MIVYHITPTDKIIKLLSQGLQRPEKRFYVFSKWNLVEIILKSLLIEPNGSILTNFNVLVLNVDSDILVPEPIPNSQLLGPLELEEHQLLQSQSFYLETDLAPARIVAIKDTYGNDITKRYKQGKGSKHKSLLRFLAYAKPYWRYYVLATTAGIVKFLAPLAFPWILRVILDDIVLNTNLGIAQRKTKILYLVLGVLFVNTLWMGACFLRSIYTAMAGHRMIRDLRVALFNHVQRLSHQFFTKRQSGAIVSRVVNDIAQAQNFVGSALTNVWMDGVLLVVLLIILFKIHYVLTVVALILTPIFLFSIRFVGSRIRLASREIQQRVEILSGGLQEKIMGVSIIKGFTREKEESKAFASQANKLYSKVLRSVRYSATNEMIVGFVVLSAPVLVLWYGTNQIMQNRLTIGELTQFLLYLAMFYAPLQRLSDLNLVLANSLAAIERIFEYFDIQPHVMEQHDAKELPEVEGLIEFDHVQFGYESDNLVLHDITLQINPGETVAFVGESGSGKSSMANLVPRFYDPIKGIIRLDGYDLRTLKLISLRAHIGIVNQETILFSGTVRENLLLANPLAFPDEIEQALIAANALEFVEEMPEGLWTEIGEHGVMLSGGQKQRLAIARAFLKNPKILILDEATSALDSKSERQIQEALSRLLNNRTSIVIAHRLSTVLNADKIVVVEQGEIVEAGTHHQLLELNGYYAQLYNEQFFHINR